jgi:hypothetical protein
MDDVETSQVKLRRYRRLLAATSDQAAVRTIKTLIAEIEAKGREPSNRPVLQAEQEQLLPPGEPTSQCGELCRPAARSCA